MTLGEEILTPEEMHSSTSKWQQSLYCISNHHPPNSGALAAGPTTVPGIHSLVELLQGRLSDGVMRVVTDEASGLFPSSSEIQFSCSCPDLASLCRHVAAVIYGVGSCLDSDPSLLFTLRGVDHTQLLGTTGLSSAAVVSIDESELADIFGIEIESTTGDERHNEEKAGSDEESRQTRE